MKKILYAVFIVFWILAAFSLLCVISSFAHADSAITLYASHKSGDLNIRDKPYGERVGYLLPGDEVEFVSQDGEWILVKEGIENGGGWVKADYLTADPDAAGTYCNISGSRVRIRKTPGGASAGWLKTGKTVDVLSVLPDETGDMWGRTKKGYIMLSLLERCDPDRKD